LGQKKKKQVVRPHGGWRKEAQTELKATCVKRGKKKSKKKKIEKKKSLQKIFVRFARGRGP